VTNGLRLAYASILPRFLGQSIGRRAPALPDVPTPGTPEQLDSHVRAEIAKYRRIVSEAAIKPEG
jgi:hypothetical protein